MLCPKCGTENPDNAPSCSYCSASLFFPPPRPKQTSGLAIASLVLGILGFITIGITGAIGMILGALALHKISKKPLEIGGQPLAIVGIVLSAISFCLMGLMVAVLMPALGRAREMAKRVQCASQLRGLGNATTMYNSDYDGYNPIPWTDKVKKAGFGTGWYNQPGMSTHTRWIDTNWKESNWDQQPTVGGCLYLLVKWEDVAPKAFVCPSARNDEEMDFESALTMNPAVEDWSDLNDFRSGYNLSYSMNDPWGNPLHSSSDSGIAYMADKSNKFDTGDFRVRPNTGDHPHYDMTRFWTDDGDISAGNEAHGNSNNHNTEAQNVLYAGGHVERYEIPTVGLGEDNIYTAWPNPRPTKEQKMLGIWGSGIFVGSQHTHRNDSYLGN